MKKKIKIFILVLFASTLFLSAASPFTTKDEINAGSQADAVGAESEETIPDSVDDLLANLDLDGLQSIVELLDKNQLEVFGFADVAERIRAIANGEYQNDFNGIVSYALSLIGANVLEFLPLLLAVLAIVIAYSIISSVKGKFASESIERVVYFATGGLAVTLTVGYFSSVLVSSVKLVASVKTQINGVAPVLLTLMTAAGASGSAGVYTPTVAALGSGMTGIVTFVAFPALLMALTFDVIDSVSTLKLGKTSEFFRSASKWLRVTAFFLFITVISVSKYVPIIGGYLSQGFDFIMAGNVLIKNAIGTSAVALVVLFVLPVVSKVAVFTLTLKLTAAVAEPLGGERFCGIMTSVSKSSSLIGTVIVAMTALYVLFLTMLVCTGNIGL